MKTYNNPAKRDWEVLCTRPVASAAALGELANEVFTKVQQEGDAALRFYTQEFDSVAIADVRVSTTELKLWAAKTPAKLKRAIDNAYKNITVFHQAQMLKIEAETVETQPGVVCWREARPIERVGLYVPGGTAPLISTVLMLGVPAQIAGCKQVILATPPSKDGTIAPAICYAALKVGVDTMLRVGGMQAVAAMALGTASVTRVDKLFGPGNQYVTAAKQRAVRYGVAIDMPAGPSEVMVVADKRANPAFVAADLLSQAEHGQDSQVVLVATSNAFADSVKLELKRQVDTLPRKNIAEQTLVNSFCVILPELESAVAFANVYAPEHLILCVANAETLTERVSNAGSVFLGDYSPESAGDYASGTNHTLPTNGWARSYGGVSLESFTKKITFQKLTKRGLAGLAETIETLARAEGLEAHARAVGVRISTKGSK